MGAIQWQPNENLEIAYDGSGLHLDFTRDFDNGFVQAVKFGAAISSRDKCEHGEIWSQTVTQNSGVAIPAGAIIDAKSASYWSDLPDYLCGIKVRIGKMPAFLMQHATTMPCPAFCFFRQTIPGNLITLAIQEEYE